MRLGRLPAGLEDPLHLMEPWPWGKLLMVVFLTLLLAFLVWRRRRRPVEKVLVTPPPLPGSPPPPRGLVEAVGDLRRRYGRTGDFRRACHDLAELVRRHLEHRSGRPYSVLTAGEIRRQEGDTPLARIFGRLAGLQFGRVAPSRRDFDETCDSLIQATQEKP